MDGLSERVRILRESEGLSRDDFGERLGVSRDVILNIEMARLARPEQKEPLFKLMCKEFGASYEWIMTGQGSMKVMSQEDAIERFASEHGISYYAKKVLESYLALEGETKEAVDGWLYGLVESCAGGATVEVFNQAAGGGIIPLTGQTTKSGANVTISTNSNLKGTGIG